MYFWKFPFLVFNLLGWNAGLSPLSNISILRSMLELFSNPVTLNFFKFKDRVPLSLASSVVYQYTCRQCSATYICETKKQLRVRISQHKGISFRTNRPLSSFDSSKIYEHAFDSNHPISDDSFKNLSNSTVFDMKVCTFISFNQI